MHIHRYFARVERYNKVYLHAFPGILVRMEKISLHRVYISIFFCATMYTTRSCSVSIHPIPSFPRLFDRSLERNIHFVGANFYLISTGRQDGNKVRRFKQKSLLISLYFGRAPGELSPPPGWIGWSPHLDSRLARLFAGIVIFSMGHFA